MQSCTHVAMALVDRPLVKPVQALVPWLSHQQASLVTSPATCNIRQRPLQPTCVYSCYRVTVPRGGCTKMFAAGDGPPGSRTVPYSIQPHAPRTVLSPSSCSQQQYSLYQAVPHPSTTYTAYPVTYVGLPELPFHSREWSEGARLSVGYVGPRSNR